MRENKAFLKLFICGLAIPVVFLFLLAYSGVGVVSKVHNFIFMIPGGTVNSRFIMESIALNSSAFYLGIISGCVTALLCIPIIKIKKYETKDLLYIVVYPILMLMAIIYFAFLKGQNDLLHANPFFRQMSFWYFSTCIYYTMSLAFFYLFSFVPFVMFISLPVKLIKRKNG